MIGIYKRDNKYVAQCTNKHLGTFNTHNQAISARFNYMKAHNIPYDSVTGKILKQKVRAIHPTLQGKCYTMGAKVFIENAKKIHGLTYSYNNIVYTNRDTKLIITCKSHGDFQATPKNHLRGGGKCPICFPPGILRIPSISNITNQMSNTASQLKASNEFISKAQTIHNNEYTYKNSIYTKSSEKLLVTCAVHGDFTITPNNHLRNKGCPKCALAKRGWNKSIYKNIKTILYIVNVNNTYFKIGITKKSIKERYYKDVRDGNIITTLLEQHFFDGSDAFDLEKKILRQTHIHKYSGPQVLTHGGDSELRTANIVNLTIDLIKELNETRHKNI